MHKKILIISHSGDLHADLVTAILAQRGHAPFRINLDAFPRDYQLCQRLLDGRTTATGWTCGKWAPCGCASLPSTPMPAPT